MMLVIYIEMSRENSTDVCNIVFRVTYFADNINNNTEHLLHVSDVQTCAKEGMRISDNVRN